jgi:hypothetical protein
MQSPKDIRKCNENVAKLYLDGIKAGTIRNPLTGEHYSESIINTAQRTVDLLIKEGLLGDFNLKDGTLENFKERFSNLRYHMHDGERLAIKSLLRFAKSHQNKGQSHVVAAHSASFMSYGAEASSSGAPPPRTGKRPADSHPDAPPPKRSHTGLTETAARMTIASLPPLPSHDDVGMLDTLSGRQRREDYINELDILFNLESNRTLPGVSDVYNRSHLKITTLLQNQESNWDVINALNDDLKVPSYDHLSSIWQKLQQAHASTQSMPNLSQEASTSSTYLGHSHSQHFGSSGVSAAPYVYLPPESLQNSGMIGPSQPLSGIIPHYPPLPGPPPNASFPFVGQTSGPGMPSQVQSVSGRLYPWAGTNGEHRFVADGGTFKDHRRSILSHEISPSLASQIVTRTALLDPASGVMYFPVIEDTNQQFQINDHLMQMQGSGAAGTQPFYGYGEPTQPTAQQESSPLTSVSHGTQGTYEQPSRQELSLRPDDTSLLGSASSGPYQMQVPGQGMGYPMQPSGSSTAMYQWQGSGYTELPQTSSRVPLHGQGPLPDRGQGQHPPGARFGHPGANRGSGRGTY